MSYISEDELFKTYTASRKTALSWFEPFPEFERIARNKPHPGIDKSLPKVTDGTLAALIQESPKRVIQQIPTGKVECEDDTLEIIGSEILEKHILPYANTTADLLQKSWAGISKSATYGSQPAMVQMVSRPDYFGPDFTLPYICNVILEPGKVSDRDSNVIMVEAYYQKNQIEAIIKKEETLTQNSITRGDKDKYESGWDLSVLEEIKDTKAQKDPASQTPAEKNGKKDAGFILIVHVFQRGIGAQFYSFSPRLDKIVRRKKNPDPRGVIPIHFLYMNVDLSNPYGRGAVDISGGMQNLLDSEVQTYQYMRTLMMTPPLEVRGNVVKSSLKFAPGALWDMGTDPNASVTPAKLETASLTQFPQNYGLIKSQILNLNAGGNDNAISATAGDPQTSKTPQGVQANQARLGIADNYLRKQFEDWFEQICETMLNLWFAERSGIQELELSEEAANKLERLSPGTVKDGKIRIDYDTETPKIRFKVDASSSSMEDNAKQVEIISGLLERLEKNPILAQIVPKDKIVEAWNTIVSSSGVEDPEKLQIDMKQEQETPPMTPQMVQQMIGQAMQQADSQKQQQQQEHPLVKLMTSLNIKFTDLGANAQNYIVQNVIGAPADNTTPSQVAMATKASDSAVKVAQMHHTMNLADANHQQANQSHALALAQAIGSQDQQLASHDLASQQAQDSQANTQAQMQQADNNARQKQMAGVANG